MSYTLTETGKVLTETQEGITMPVDYSFATVNDYVHGMEVQFEELQSLCLGMADYIDKLMAARIDRESWAQICDQFDSENPHIGQAKEVARLLRSK